MKDEYQRLLKQQIKQAGEWLIDNNEKLVSDVQYITDFEITISLKNGDTLPTIMVKQENLFWRNYDHTGKDR